MSVVALADWITDFFYDRLEVVGAETVPLDRPVIFAANHHSGLMDALLMYAASPRNLRPVGKSTLWDIFPLRPFLKAADVIPVRRVRDGGGSNAEAFAAVRDALAEGGAIVIFVEGTSHDNPGLEPIKTGAARMAFEALAAGASPLVVPTGIIFSDRERFRSDALVRFGEPIDVAAGFPGATSEDRDQVRALTAQIEDGLRRVAPVWENEDQRAAARAAAIGNLPVGASLASVEAEAERLAALDGTIAPPPRDGLVGARGETQLLVPPEEIDRVAAAIVAPLAIAGKWTNRPPFVLVRTIARRGDLNIRATHKAAAGLLLFPLWWTLIAVAAAVAGAGLWSIAIAGVVAVLGLIAAREYPRSRAEQRTLRHLSATASGHDPPT